MAGNTASGDRSPHASTAPACGARTRRGTDCRAPAMLNGRCRVHGGSTPKGMDSPHWKHGRWSKYLGPSVAPIVDEMARDFDRHSMDQELTIVDARIAQTLTRLKSGESTPAWDGLRRALGEFESAQVTGDPRTRPQRMHKALARVGSLVAEGAGEADAWREVLDLIERRRILIESEERRSVLNGKSIPADQVLNMIASISRLILDEVADPAARRRVNERLLALAHGNRLPAARLPARVLEGGT